MSCYWSKVILCVLVIFSWESTSPVLAASEPSEQPVTTELSATSEDCQISDAAREAIDDATEAWMKAGNVPEALDLILQAEKAATPPECDNDKAITLANQAIEIVGETKDQDEKDSTTPKSSTVRYKASSFVMFANCDFSGEMKRQLLPFGDYWRNGPLGPPGYITSSSVLPFIVTAIFPYYISSRASGTSGCEKFAYIKLQQHRFAFIAKDNLVRDMANGGGEFVTTMAYLQGCPTSTYTHYAIVTQSHFADIYPRPETDPSKMLSNLEFQIAQDSFLSGNCKWAS